MSLPTTSLLDAFTRANENPLSQAGKWAAAFDSAAPNPFLLTSNTVKSTSGTAQAYRTDISAGDTEAWVDLATVPPDSSHGASVWGRIQNPGNGSTATGYDVTYFPTVGFRLYKLTAGHTYTQIGATYNPSTLSNGQAIGIQCVGTSISAYYGASQMLSGVTLVNTWIDSAITGAGTIGMSVDESVTTVLDNYGGGAIMLPIPIRVMLQAVTTAATR